MFQLLDSSDWSPIYQPSRSPLISPQARVAEYEKAEIDASAASKQKQLANQREMLGLAKEVWLPLSQIVSLAGS